MLFDQIQSTSTAGVLSYKVLSERKKNKQYHVKIEAIVEDHRKQNFDEKLEAEHFVGVVFSQRVKSCNERCVEEVDQHKQGENYMPKHHKLALLDSHVPWERVCGCHAFFVFDEHSLFPYI